MAGKGRGTRARARREPMSRAGALPLLRAVAAEYIRYRRFVRQPPERRRHSRSPDRFVEALLALGPTFVKVGQILSTRPDLLPVEYVRALERLQEHVPPEPFDSIRVVIEAELGKPLDVAFTSFEPVPVASASLAQVHFAVLPDGEPVAVKVQRPGIGDRIRAEMDLLQWLLGWVARLSPGRIRRANLAEGLREFRRYTLRELDFVAEARTMDRFRKVFAGWDQVRIPAVFQSHTSVAMLTMERARGLRLREVLELLPPATKEDLARTLAAVQMKMFVADGLFHADLHPGNLFFAEDGAITLLDFGMIGELSEEERDRFILYWLAVVRRQTRRAFHHFKRQTRTLPGADETAFFRDFSELAERFYRSTVSDLTVAQVYLAMIASGYRHGFAFPADLLLHAKAITSAEALIFTLAPDLRFDELTRPAILREFVRRASDPERLLRQFGDLIPELALTGELLPWDARDHHHPDYAADPPWEDLRQALIAGSAGPAGPYLLRRVLDPIAHAVLLGYHGKDEAEVILERTWVAYAELERDIPVLDQIGPTWILHLAGATRAMNRALRDAGHGATEAAEILYEIGWRVYRWMGAIPFALASAISADPAKKLAAATRAFRAFPFAAPAYRWRDVPSPDGVVAFDCLQCPVATYFRSHGEGDLCYATFCQLDFPLAEQWGARLERTGTLAIGAPFCDFRWRLQDQGKPFVAAEGK